MIVEQIVPGRGHVELSALLDAVATSALAAPFDDRLVELFSEVSGQLLARGSAGQLPDVRALAFWMRRSHLLSLKHEFEAQSASATIRVPRGTVFHVPPANVDTIFVYSWMLSALCGNRNVVRLPQRRTEIVSYLCETLDEVLASCDPIPAAAFVGYGHEPEITAAITERSDVRVIWGGDATVAAIREIPLPPRAVEIAFADRYSFAAIDAGAYLGAASGTRNRIVEDFVSDTFPWDQGACSSPQLVVWRGAEADAARAAADFYPRVATAAASHGYAIDAGTAVAQALATSRLAADVNVRTGRRYGRELFVVEVEEPAAIDRHHVGGGYLLSLRVASLVDLAPFLAPSDQTVTQFGFGEADLREFARAAAARGAVDRIVPIGQALAFDHVWDGYDLLAAFTRTVRVTR